MLVPISESEDPGAPDDPYDVAPDDIRPKKVVPVSASPLDYQRPQTVNAGADTIIYDRTKDLHLPVALLVIGIAVSFLEAVFNRRIGAQGIQDAGLTVVIGLVINVVIMLTGLFVAAKIRGMAFGPFWTAVLKLCAIAVAPGAAYTLVVLLFKPFGFLAVLAGWIVSFILYFALVGALFDLDESDTWFCVVLIFFLRILAVFLLLAVATG